LIVQAELRKSFHNREVFIQRDFARQKNLHGVQAKLTPQGFRGTALQALTLTFVIAPSLAVSYSFRVMYDDFQAIDRWTAQPLHCQYQALIVAIATRHADAVDIKFLVGDRPVWIALPHVAWVEFNRQTGKVITDPMAVQIAGHYLKWAIESGEDSGREMYPLTVQETLDHLDAIIEENQASAVAR
jgi:hypothetical protein